MGWEIPWVTITDSFDADFGVDEWHGTNVFFRDGDHVFRTYFVNNRGDEQMGGTWKYLDITPLGRQEVWEDSPEGLSPDPDLQMVELARQLRPGRGARQEVGRGGRMPERRHSGTRIPRNREPAWRAAAGAPYPPARISFAASMKAPQLRGDRRPARIVQEQPGLLDRRRRQHLAQPAVVPARRGPAARTHRRCRRRPGPGPWHSWNRLTRTVPETPTATSSSPSVRFPGIDAAGGEQAEADAVVPRQKPGDNFSKAGFGLAGPRKG